MDISEDNAGFILELMFYAVLISLLICIPYIAVLVSFHVSAYFGLGAFASKVVAVGAEFSVMTSTVIWALLDRKKR